MGVLAGDHALALVTLAGLPHITNWGLLVSHANYLYPYWLWLL
jgi:hypothetical protein